MRPRNSGNSNEIFSHDEETKTAKNTHNHPIVRLFSWQNYSNLLYFTEIVTILWKSYKVIFRTFQDDEMVDQRSIRAPQLRLRFGRTDPLWSSFNENALLEEKRAPSQRLRWGRSGGMVRNAWIEHMKLNSSLMAIELLLTYLFPFSLSPSVFHQRRYATEGNPSAPITASIWQKWPILGHVQWAPAGWTAICRCHATAFEGA